MSAPVIFILGAGPGIGFSVAKSFAAKGYKVALAARSFSEGTDEDGHLRIKLDLEKTADIPGAFEKVKEQLGLPSVVVYNGASRTVRDAKNPLASIALEDAQKEFAVNTLSALFSAQEAVKAFKELPKSASRTFIFTGNKLNVLVWPHVVVFGIGKTATAKMIQDASVAYQPEGFRFYYVDERQADGGPTIPVGGPAAGAEYVRLAEDKEQRPWHYTFIDGKGYVDFKGQ